MNAKSTEKREAAVARAADRVRCDEQPSAKRVRLRKKTPAAAAVAAPAMKPLTPKAAAAPKLARADVDWQTYKKRMHYKAYHAAETAARKDGYSDEMVKARARAAGTAEVARLMEERMSSQSGK